MDDKVGYVAIALFVLSEILGFTKKTKGNGILHSLLCLLNGSECVVKNVKEQVEKQLDIESKGIDTKEIGVQTD